MALRGALGSGLGARDAAALYVAGVAQPYIHLRFARQAWHKLTSTLVLRGRRGTYGIGWRAWSGFVAGDVAALCVADVVLGDTHLHFTHPPSFCVAGVALMALGGVLGLCVSELCGCLTSLEKLAQLAS